MATLCGPIGGTATDPCDPDGKFGKMFLAEIVGTFLFVSVNVNIIYNNGSKEIILNAIIIGLALCVGIMVAAPTSGAAINPGVGLVQPIFQNIVSEIKLTSVAIHVFGPFVGGILAGCF
jgi:glycerol uptake facilitator-like aquaporin